MIGQNKNKELLMNWRMNKSVPRFIIIEGDVGSGRLTLAKVIMKIINATGVIAGNSISNIREIIENAYTVSDTTCYIFRDCDDMSVAAKNSLLKVVEEPPNKAYFIMTVKNIDDMLGTIRSRATCIKIEPYTHEELSIFNDDEVVLKYARTPTDTTMDRAVVNQISGICDDIIQQLIQRKGTNTLKDYLKLESIFKDTPNIDKLYVLRIFETKLLENYTNFTPNCLDPILACKKELKKAGINSKASIESMLIKIVEELKNESKISTEMG